jgi:hypothetical protein
MKRIRKPGVPKFAKAAIYPSLYVFTLLPTRLPKSFLKEIMQVFDSLDMKPPQKQRTDADSVTTEELMLKMLDRQPREKDLAIKFTYLWEKGIQDYSRTAGGAPGILSSSDDYQRSSFIINFILQRREVKLRVSTIGTIVQEMRISKPIAESPKMVQNLFQAILKHSWITIKDKLVEMPTLGFLSSLLKKREFFPIGYSIKGPKESFENAILGFVPMISDALEIAKEEKNTQAIIMLKSLMSIYSERIREVESEMETVISSEVMYEWDSRRFEIEYEAENISSSTLRNIEETLEKMSLEMDESLE